LGIDSAELLVGGGEDYELLFALTPKGAGLAPAALRKRLGVAVSQIGRVVPQAGIRGLPAISTGHHF